MNDGRRAVIVVDLQNDYFPGGKWELAGIEAAAKNAASVIAAARKAGDLVVFIRHEFPTIDAPFFAPGSDGAKINDVVINNENESVVLKHQINAFRDTNLKRILEENHIEEVIVCGAMSHMCVDAVVRAANDYGYKVSVVHDACASRDMEFNGVHVPAATAHAAFMAALGFGYATMMTAGEFVDSTNAGRLIQSK